MRVSGNSSTQLLPETYLYENNVDHKILIEEIILLENNNNKDKFIR